jgi:hypothetical protein
MYSQGFPAMSLINDALKKAQKLQMQGQTPPPPNPGGAPSTPSAPSSPGGSGAYSLPSDSTHSAGSTSSPQAISPRASSGGQQSMTGQLFMLLAFGAGALIAVSVLATVYLLRRQPAAPTVAAAPAVPEKPTPALSSSNGPAPVINTPQAALPQTTPPAAPAQMTAPAAAVAVTTAPATTPSMPATLAAAPFFSSPTPPAPSQSSGLDSTKPDPKILAYLDALQVAGIRMSDTGNKVLMNDRVFREGEIVDQLLGLRLKKVESDMLTFVDDRGVIYTKNL